MHTPLDDPRIEALATALATREAPPQARSAAGSEPTTDQVARASVALVVRPAPSDLELLVIKRATRAGDPWSGHLAFPGGRQSPEDDSARATAERETAEEVGIRLAHDGRFLGPLDPVWPRSGAPSVVVAPFVFAVTSGVDLVLNHEVADAFWIPLRTLTAPGSATEYLHALAEGEELRFPAIAYESHVIWGLTHRIMTEFLDIVRHALDGEGAG